MLQREAKSATLSTLSAAALGWLKVDESGPSKYGKALKTKFAFGGGHRALAPQSLAGPSVSPNDASTIGFDPGM
jgi:hypothetical protein